MARPNAGTVSGGCGVASCSPPEPIVLMGAWWSDGEGDGGEPGGGPSTEGWSSAAEPDPGCPPPATRRHAAAVPRARAGARSSVMARSVSQVRPGRRPFVEIAGQRGYGSDDVASLHARLVGLLVGELRLRVTLGGHPPEVAVDLIGQLGVVPAQLGAHQRGGHRRGPD